MNDQLVIYIYFLDIYVWIFLYLLLRYIHVKRQVIKVNNRLKMWREKTELNQDEVANRTGKNILSQKQVSRIEQDPMSQNLDMVLTYLRIVSPEKIQKFISDCLQS